MLGRLHQFTLGRVGGGQNQAAVHGKRKRSGEEQRHRDHVRRVVMKVQVLNLYAQFHGYLVGHNLDKLFQVGLVLVQELKPLEMQAMMKHFVIWQKIGLFSKTSSVTLK